ncbi:MAG TPA: VTT domain-containing protein [Bryobacteraceae bacterium]|nr:VTT domain-containing protein [Bryobacteraceae bacterium]
MLDLLRAAVDFIRTLYNAERLIQFLSSVMVSWVGYVFMAAIVFSETGLLLGFFLPGDSFLFTVGVVAGAGGHNIVAIQLLLLAAAITGNATGYSLGRRTGPRIFNRPDSRLFKHEHLMQTQAFYEKHGGKTIIYAQFVPIIRTFAPFVAGVAGMNYFRFAAFNVIGAIAWIISMTTLGYTLGNIPVVRGHFEKVVIAIIAVSFLPVLIEYWKSRRRSTAVPPPENAEAAAD